MGEWMYSSIHSLTSALDGGEWSASRPGRFTPREGAPGTRWIGDWVGTRAVLDAVLKRKIPNPRRKSNPRTPIVQLLKLSKRKIQNNKNYYIRSFFSKILCSYIVPLKYIVNSVFYNRYLLAPFLAEESTALCI
jgi:hypothetical protein